MRKIGFLFGVVMLSVIAQSWADNQSPFAHLDYDAKTMTRSAVPVRVKTAIDGTTLLSQEGQIYSLTGLDIPEDLETAPKAQKRLSALSEGQNCTLYQTKSDKAGRINRMNQIMGHLTCGKDDLWLQGILVGEGLARVRTTPENNLLAAPLLKIETQARDKKTGLWATPANSLFTPDTARNGLNRFAIVEGQVYAVSQNKNSIFLNFTSDWKTDFTVGIPAKLRRQFSKPGMNVLFLEGKKIRVRGWMRDYNGPYIELDHVDQLEILDQTHPLPPSTSQPEDSKNNSTEFMHSISGPSAPDAPIVPKPQNDKAN